MKKLAAVLVAVIFVVAGVAAVLVARLDAETLGQSPRRIYGDD